MIEKGYDCKTVAEYLVRKDVVIVDVRGPLSWKDGVPAGSKLMAADDLRVEKIDLKSQYNQIFIICHKGNLSNQLASELGEGFVSIIGGYERWVSSDLLVEVPDVNEIERYDRQLKLTGFGLAEQLKLKKARVLIVGLGGLGSPVATYLAAAGVGQLTLIDDDVVEIHNLHRQVHYQENDACQFKVNAAARRLRELNSNIEIIPIKGRLTDENAEELIKNIDLVIDGSDNLTTRYVINKVCLKHTKPWVFAAVSGFNIQVSLFTGKRSDQCFQCLFGEIPDEAIGNCNDEGILGPVPGMAAMLQATECLKQLTNMGSLLNQKMLNYDLLNHEFKVLKYSPNSNRCPLHNEIT